MWLLLTCACLRRPLETPIPRDSWPPPSDEDLARLVVLLPGYIDDETLFRTHGFPVIAAGQSEMTRGWQWVALDAHVGYYQAGQMPGRVQSEVLAEFPDVPVTVVGASFGGFGALFLARHVPERVDEVVLLAPYLGRRALLKRLIDEGPAGYQPKNRREAELVANWRFLLEAARQGRPKVTILVGERDRLLPAIELLRSRAPSIKVETAPGGHKWRVWRAMFADYLSRRAEESGVAP
ncbi:alpha/beta fold hydrolase [Acanthopleuribacter pedis]|uniref:Alpha/beta fold hydrolase n=1 Tax=Acanthopleuribacter pedis TaxID=442870 RepID=A0A8J7Q7Q1_9BACT|nr:alpha/beta fold hydrolase [Acanthopleuribacter pedis]